MFRLVTEQVGQEPIIIDADDLLKQPGMAPIPAAFPRCFLAKCFERLFCADLPDVLCEALERKFLPKRNLLRRDIMRSASINAKPKCSLVA